MLALLAAAVDVCDDLEGMLKVGVKVCGWQSLMQDDNLWVRCCGVITQHSGSTSIFGIDCRILFLASSCSDISKPKRRRVIDGKRHAQPEMQRPPQDSKTVEVWNSWSLLGLPIRPGLIGSAIHYCVALSCLILYDVQIMVQSQPFIFSFLWMVGDQ